MLQDNLRRLQQGEEPMNVFRWVSADDGQREVPVQGIHDERMAELEEMYQTLTSGHAERHDGRWGTAPLEVVLAMRQSAQEHREILLSHQCDAY
jgi:hypothetical protein